MNLLDHIFDAKKIELADTIIRAPLAEVKARAADAEPARGFLRALTQAPGLALIAEVKRASPVKGVLNANLDVANLARTYSDAGAQCLSVLTDTPHFQGSPDDLRLARATVNLPALRKDFTTDPYHVYEARAMGADAILLIVYGLTDAQLREFRELAETLGMDVLVEAHSEQEAERALSTGATLLGINNRDLTSFETSLDVGERILPQFSGRATLVAESAIKDRDGAQRMEAAGAKALLIGTAFSTSNNPGAKVREVMGW